MSFLQKSQQALAMANCPSVLSIGRLCLDDEYAFWWPWQSQTPMLIDSAYNAHYFDVENYVPMINDDPDEQNHTADSLPLTVLRVPSQRPRQARMSQIRFHRHAKSNFAFRHLVLSIRCCTCLRTPFAKFAGGRTPNSHNIGKLPMTKRSSTTTLVKRWWAILSDQLGRIMWALGA